MKMTLTLIILSFCLVVISRSAEWVLLVFSFKIGLQISRARTPTYFVAQSDCREEKKRVHLRNQIYKRD